MNLLIDHPWLFAIPSLALIAFAAWLCRGDQAAVRRCIGCGCSDLAACPGGCSWVSLEPPVCSTCWSTNEWEEAA